MDVAVLLVLAVLAATVILFVTEALRVDVVAILVMLSLGWLGLVTPAQAFSGFASNAVLSVIAVMILGYGIDRTGVMSRIARKIVEIAGEGEKSLMALVSGVVGVISAFMQNIGSAALFLPALLKISRKTHIPASRLLMPMGFAAILGGTLTMVGSSPLILLNDLLVQGNLEPFGFFDVTPVGIVLLLSGILYFYLFGSYVLPQKSGEEEAGLQEELIGDWQLPSSMHHYRITSESSLAGKTRDEIPFLGKYHLHLLAVMDKGDVLYAPWRYTVFSQGMILTLLGDSADAGRFSEEYHLRRLPDQAGHTERIGGENAGFAEIVVRPRAPKAGMTLRDTTFRKTWGVEPIVALRGGDEKRGDFSDHVLTPGDIFVVFGPWDRIAGLRLDRTFASVTSVEMLVTRPSKAVAAVACFLLGIGLTLTGMPIALALLSGVAGMILLRVVTIDEAYRSVDWRTVFLLAGLIPLGLAMDATGTAAWIASGMMDILSGTPPFLILLAIGALATFLSLFMSNVAATVLLVPLVLVIGVDSGVDPRGLALLVAVCASNSFILPTHQVNAFLMGPGGYRNADYMRAGGVMTVLFLFAATAMIYILFV